MILNPVSLGPCPAGRRGVAGAACALSRPGRLRLGRLKPLFNLKLRVLAVALAAVCLGCADADTRPASVTQERGDPALVPHSSRVPGTVFRDTLKDGGQGPQMVVLPTGSFIMGSPTTETGRDSDERPMRTVTISKRIAMGRYEVTFDDYKRFTDDPATTLTLPGDEGWGRGTRPVIKVSWNDAKAYAAWLSAQTGKMYRLPSEAEWEYAARAGTRTRYSWGNDIICSQARYGRRPILDGECSSSFDGTVPVGSFEPNAFGLYDMHGNVWEWVEDCWHDNYEGAPSDGSAWTSGCGSDVRAVLRGGSWFFYPRYLRSADRDWNGPSSRSGNIGFRLVQDLNP